ncbi:Acyl carrier protein [compost metagenome]
MKSQEFIYELLERKFSVQTAGIHKDSKLRELGLDSFDIFFFVAELENRLGCSIPDQNLLSFQRIGDVIDYMDRNQVKAGDNA